MPRSNTEGFSYVQYVKYKKMSREELEQAVADKDFDKVLSGMIPLVRKISFKYYTKYELLFEEDDRLQIATIALWNAMVHYKPNPECKFTSYASKGMLRAVKHEMDVLNRRVRKPENPIVSLDNEVFEGDDGSQSYIDSMYDETDNIERTVINNESLKEIRSAIPNVKNDNQKKMLKMALEGYEQKVIARELGVSRQYVSLTLKKFGKKMNKDKYLCTGF